MKKIIILIIGLLFAGSLFAATYTFNLSSINNISGISSPSYGAKSRLTSRAQNISISLLVPSGFSYGNVETVKRDIQTLLNTRSGAGLSITNAQLQSLGKGLDITLAISENDGGAARTIDFTFNVLGVTKKITYEQSPKTLYSISPSELYVLPYRPPYTITLSGSGVGKTYLLYKNNSVVSTKTGTGSSLGFQITYGELTAGVSDVYTIREGDNEFRGCVATCYNEIAQKRYQAPQASYDVSHDGGDVIIRCEWPKYDNIGQLGTIIEKMNDGSYSYAWNNKNVTIAILDYDVSSFCVLQFKFTANTASGSRSFSAPFLFNNGNEVVFNQLGDNPLKAYQNWIKQTKYTSATGDSKNTTTTYFDGLSRQIQTVYSKAAADQSNKDIINIISYDALGRSNAKSYLPFAKQQVYAGSYLDNAIQEQQTYYNATFSNEGAYAYVENEYEQSPLNRIVSRTNVGKVYRDNQKKTHYTYTTNGDNEVLRVISSSVDIGFSVDGYFAKSTLYKMLATDEDGNMSIDFYDADNRLILQRKVNANSNHDTYFTYDDLGRVANVIPPQASRELTAGMQYTVNTELFANFCYGYRYDHNGNITVKKIPGKVVEFLIYDKAGRVVMYQDGVLRSTNYWVYTCYDSFDNQVSSKIVNSVNAQLGRDAIQQKFNAEAWCRSVDYNTETGNFEPYSGFNVDFTEIIGLKELKYYGFGTHTTPTALAFKNVAGIASSTDVQECKGSKQYERIKILDGGSISTDTGYAERAYYYDAKNRLLQMVEQHPNSTLSRYSYKYDFVDNVIATQEAHTVNGRTDSLNSHHNIYNGGQLTSSVRNLNNSIEATINYNRNELGKMISKDYGSAANNLTETYSYNIQGWLTEQSCERFTSRLRYYNPKHGAAPSYTGNITEWEWAHPDLYMSGNFSPNAILPDTCCYLYTYDNLSQLKSSQLMGYDPYFNSWMAMDTQGEAQSYDFNGNISTLQRQDEVGDIVDNLTYSYSGNQLTTLKNNAQSYSYAYDANGNMINDGLNSLKLKYNYLNLIQEVSDLNNNPKAKYSYLADGTKQGVKDRLSRNGYEYYGTFRYALVNGVKKLESVPYEGGRIVVSSSGSGTSMTYAYNLNAYTTDHLMSTRGAKYNASDTAFEDYYSFGKGWGISAYSSNFDKFTYNGKEMQTTGWLPYLDYGARMYDPRIGRWFGQDPLAEKYYSTSPYAFCGNNPINFVDMDGLKRIPGGNRRETSEFLIDADAVVIYGKRTSSSDWFASQRVRYQNTVIYRDVDISFSGGGGSGPINGAKRSRGEGAILGGVVGTRIGGIPGGIIGATLGSRLYSTRMFAHYTFGSGTNVHLTKSEFEYLMKNARIHHDKASVDADGTYVTPIDFYSSNLDLRYAFGTASVNFTIENGNYNYTSFCDYYDFDAKSKGTRSWFNELITKWGSWAPGRPFNITYP